MRHVIVAIAATLLHTPLIAQSLTGVWKPVEVVIASGPAAGRHTTDLQPGLLLFSGGHYAWLRVTAFAPRPKLSTNPTDEERGRAFSPFTGQGGTYEVAGSTVTMRPTVAKNPAVMEGPPFQYGLERDGPAVWLIEKGPDGAERSRMKLARVEDQTSTKASPAAGSFDPQKLIGVWEMVTVINGNTGLVEPNIRNRRHLLIYTDKHFIAYYNSTDRAVISPEEFAKLTPAQKKEARFARYFNEAEQRPLLGGGAGEYTSDGALIGYNTVLQTDPYNIGRPRSETILRLDDDYLIVRLQPDPTGIVREETWRRIE